MKKYITLLFAFKMIISFGQTPSNDPHWQLLWQDDFNSINTSIWDVANNFDHYGEPEMYRTNNVSISGGHLVIEAKSESYMGHSYTSGMLTSTTAYSPQFGYMEARIQLPYGNGLWPAFWTFSGISGYQEIDVFEMLPGAEEYCHRNSMQQFTHTNIVMTSNIHLQGPDGTCDDPYAAPSVNIIQDYTQWHTYGIEWSPTKIVWYIDNYPVRYYANSQINAPTTIILNLAINPYVTVTSGFPADMLVDYVKVWGLADECNEYINATNYDFSTYNNKVKNFIIIGDPSSTNSLNSGDDITIRASQFIDINEITIPLGASFYADADKDCQTDLSTECSQTFNPCSYNFSSYDNSIKSNIELGDNGCILNITPASTDLILQATNEIVLKPGVHITPTSTKSVELKIVACH